MEPLGRTLLWLGALLIVVGALLSFGVSIPGFGKLPGDIHFERGGTRIFFPITSCLVASAVLSGVLWIVSRLR